MAKKSTKKTADVKKVLTVDNSVNPDAKTVYVAWCGFTTMKMNKEGRLENIKIKKGEKVTAKDVPQVWIDQAVSQKFLVKKEVADKLDNKEMAKLGYL
ncbi:MAG: hypothetical protein ACFFDH_00050 [Promethearchaeota archaeon]